MGRVWGESKNLTHLQLRAARRWAANRRILNHHSRVEVAGRPAGGDAPKRARQSRRRSSMEAHGHATAMQNDGATAPFILRRRRRSSSHQHDTDATRRDAMRCARRTALVSRAHCALGSSHVASAGGGRTPRSDTSFYSSGERAVLACWPPRVLSFVEA